MLSSVILQRIVAVLDRALPVDALWLFGSEATARANALSDVDLAALPQPAVDARPTPVRLQLAAQIGRDVDLIDVEAASPVLVMQILKQGKLIFEQDRARRVRFVAAAPVRYDDLLRVRRPIEAALRERLVRG